MTNPTVSVSTVFCDGGPQAGHPRIYMNLAKTGQALCPYCSQAFSI